MVKKKTLDSMETRPRGLDEKGSLLETLASTVNKAMSAGLGYTLETRSMIVPSEKQSIAALRRVSCFVIPSHLLNTPYPPSARESARTTFIRIDCICHTTSSHPPRKMSRQNKLRLILESLKPRAQMSISHSLLPPKCSSAISLLNETQNLSQEQHLVSSTFVFGAPW